MTYLSAVAFPAKEDDSFSLMHKQNNVILMPNKNIAVSPPFQFLNFIFSKCITSVAFTTLQMFRVFHAFSAILSYKRSGTPFVIIHVHTFIC